MWSWLSKIDPNVVVPLLGGLATWVWHRVSTNTKADWEGIVKAMLATLTTEILDRYTTDAGDTVEYLKRVRKYFEDRAWSVLSKRGVPRNKTTEAILNRGIEEATAFVGDEVNRIRRDKGLKP